MHVRFLDGHCAVIGKPVNILLVNKASQAFLEEQEVAHFSTKCLLVSNLDSVNVV